MSSEANNDSADSPRESSATDGADTAPQPLPTTPLPSVIIDPSIDDAPERPAESSIIVDPAMYAPEPASDAAAPEPTQTQPGNTALKQATAETPEATDRASHPTGDTPDLLTLDALSEFDADRFADSMRPSWDVAPMEPEVAVPSAIASSARARTSVNTADDGDGAAPLVLARGLDRRMLMAAAGVVLVLLWVVWSMTSSEPEAPAAWDAKTGDTQIKRPKNVEATPNVASPSPPTQAAPASTAPAITATPRTTPANVPAGASNAAQDEAPVAEPTAPSKSVHLQISTTPSGAELKLDGETVPNPFDAWVARGGSHQVLVDAQDYQQQEWTIVFDQDRTLTLALKRVVVRKPPVRRVRRAPAKKPTTTRSSPSGAGFATDNPY